MFKGYKKMAQIVKNGGDLHASFIMTGLDDGVAQFFESTLIETFRGDELANKQKVSISNEELATLFDDMSGPERAYLACYLLKRMCIRNYLYNFYRSR